MGPDLRGVTNRHPDALLTEILDPSQTVEPRYQNYVAVLKSGELVQGLIARESTQAIEFSLPDGTRRTVLRTAIEELQRLSASLMPDGLEGKIDVQGLADVIAYVAGLDRITGE